MKRALARYVLRLARRAAQVSNAFAHPMSCQVPPSSSWDDYICRDCTAKYPFMVNPSDKRFILGIIEDGDKVTRLIDHKNGMQANADIESKEVSEDTVTSKRKNEDDDQDVISKKSKLDNGSASNSNELDGKFHSTLKETHGRQRDTVALSSTQANLTQLHVLLCTPLIVEKLKHKTDLFLKEKWRQGLCRCDKVNE